MTIETILFDNLRGYDYHLALGPEYFENTNDSTEEKTRKAKERTNLETASLQLQTIIAESPYYGQGIQEGLFTEYSIFSSIEKPAGPWLGPMAEIKSHHTLGNQEANELGYKLMHDVASKTANFLKENGYSNLFLFFHPNAGEAEASYEDELIDHTQRGWLICGPSSHVPFTTTLWEKTLIPHRKYVVENWGKKTEEQLRHHLINEMNATPRHADFHINFMKEQEAKK